MTTNPPTDPPTDPTTGMFRPIKEERTISEEIKKEISTALLALPDTSDAVAASLRGALYEIQAASSPARKAWILRYALDDALAKLASARP